MGRNGRQSHFETRSEFRFGTPFQKQRYASAAIQCTLFPAMTEMEVRIRMAEWREINAKGDLC